jgi:dTDP-4-dehydrorhamnose reductase
MKNILILGCTGMLGSMLLDVFAKESHFKITATTRAEAQKDWLKKQYPSVTFKVFNAETSSVNQVINIAKNNQWIINAIGVTKPYIVGMHRNTIEKAIRINSLFPYMLINAIQNTSTTLIQIATDCVFSGEKGNYSEEDLHDAKDVYGKTKSLGEVFQKNVIHLRCSIIGPEKGRKIFLLEWFLSAVKNATLQGFSNHYWNGITTLHFAYICKAIILHNIEITHVQHVVPRNTISKYDLLCYLVKVYKRGDITLHKTSASATIDRTLQTIYPKVNQLLWEKSGYKKIPTIETLFRELAETYV